ncbi:MAG TPA: TlpA disulfide reductase family protein [Chitinophagaceae bacterium]|nr:TlpA disulfide reductase family protein [Chitinophagaceae bacterium]
MKGTVFILIVFFFSLSVSGQEVKKIKITDLEKIIAESKTPLIINFWATFCKPCMEEIPHFQKLEKKYRDSGVKLLLVSLDMKDDFPEKVNAFIKKKKIVTPTAWLDETNADYFCPKIDKAWSGAIPATLFINNRNSYRKFTEEPLPEKQLENEIRTVLQQ